MIEGSRLRHLLDTTDTEGDIRFYDDEKNLEAIIAMEDYWFQLDEVYNTEFIDDWDCEKVNEFIDDMPTNDSCSCTDEWDERDSDNAEKYLREIGVLVKIEDDEAYFDLNFESDFNEVEGDELNKNHKNLCRSYLDIPRKLFDDPLGDDFEFNPADTLELQLEKEPIPEFSSEIMKLEQKFSFLNTKLVSKIDISEPINRDFEDTNKICKEILIKVDNQQPNMKQKKLTEFAYLLQRKGFRLMRKYYKDKFENFAEEFEFKVRSKFMTLSEINSIMMKFIHAEMKDSYSSLLESELDLLINSAKCLILSDRSHKKEKINEGLDFSVVK